MKLKNKIGGQVYLDKNQIKIVDFMITMGKFDRKDVEKILDVSPATAKRLIRSLVKTDLIKQKRISSKSVFYMLNI